MIDIFGTIILIAIIVIFLITIAVYGDIILILFFVLLIPILIYRAVLLFKKK